MRLAKDKILHNLQLRVIDGLKSVGVVENIALMISEYEFLFDVMLAAL